jgi:hypothetical protein
VANVAPDHSLLPVPDASAFELDAVATADIADVHWPAQAEAKRPSPAKSRVLAPRRSGACHRLESLKTLLMTNWSAQSLSACSSSDCPARNIELFVKARRGSISPRSSDHRPVVSRVAILMNPDNASNSIFLKETNLTSDLPEQLQSFSAQIGS